MKYGEARRAAVMMGETLAGRFGKPDADFLVPVPLHKNSEREYNQAELIARGAGRIWGIEVKRPLRWSASPERQAVKASSARHLPEGAVVVRSRAVGRAFIIDDVFTSGSTVAACADSLLKAGIAVAGVAVWSRGGSD
jgi:predicted amidophosphoribosyltransferase